MSAVSRPGQSRKIHTPESFFWFRKLGNGARGTRDIEHARLGKRLGRRQRS
jgi:hypothetical protein